ncbi:acyltransferase family protein [Anaerocolumna jejuensis]|uniref:acyltransferase family protein n=1 Tax=Anaerocolumna jejuensis TaxID=259063 RepID=UPI003F7C1CEA
MLETASSQIYQKQIAGLDGLRAIAVIAIVFYHMFPHIVKGGFLGVSLFFVLSGYLMAITSWNAWEQHRFGFTEFYKKRVLRIYPSLIITVCATAFFLMILVPPAMRGIRDEVFSILGGYNNWWQISQNASYFTKINSLSPFTHLWSLAVELQYYLIWPFLFLICMAIKRHGYRKNAIRFIWVLALCSMVSMILLYHPNEDPSRIYYGTDTRLFSLLMGSALGLFQKQYRRRRKKSKECYLVSFFISILVVNILFFVADGQSAITYRMILPLTSFLFWGLIFLVSVPELPFGHWLDCKPLSWIGKRSYEIYLCQYPVAFLLRQWSHYKNSFIMMALELIIVVGMSALMYSFSSKFTGKGKRKRFK